jgi:hypothetical protein
MGGGNGRGSGFATLRAREAGRPVALGEQLPSAQWVAPSLCHGWRVCDVYGHLCCTVSTPLLPVARWCRGLALEATDIRWARPVPGGAVVRGPAEWLLAAIAGRSAAFSRVEGSGVAVLSERAGRLHASRR